MRDVIVPILARHAINYAGALTFDADALGGTHAALALYNDLLYQAWWKLLEKHLIEKDGVDHFTYMRALELTGGYIGDRLPESNGRGVALDAGRKLVLELHRMEASNG